MNAGAFPLFQAEMYGITSSISRIQRSMPSNDQLLVMSYTSKIPCKIKNKHVATVHLYTCIQNEGQHRKCSASRHLCSTRVRPEDGAEPALPRCVPVEDTRTCRVSTLTCYGTVTFASLFIAFKHLP